jgi:Bacterial virulence factor lipase N-terminal
MKKQPYSGRLNTASVRKLIHVGFVTTVIASLSASVVLRDCGELDKEFEEGKVTLSKPILFVLLLAAILFSPTLAAASGVHPLFNLQSTTQSPFPSDRFTVPDSRQNTNQRVNLPLPDCTTHPSDCLDVALLNQLDGFNTQPRISIPFDGAIDPFTVSSETVFLIRIDLSHPADLPPQTIGINQVVWDPSTLTLFAQSDQHLEQDTSYLLIVTNGVHDLAGDPIEASDSFAKFRHDLNFGQTKDPQLKLYRAALIRLLAGDVLGSIAPPLSRRDIAAASFFTTGSVTATLEKIRDQIKATPAPSVNFNIGSHGERTVFPLSSVIGILFGRQVTAVGPLSTVPLPTPALQVFPGAVGVIAFGKFSARNFETAGGFIPAVPTRTGVPAVQNTEDVFFNLFLPAGSRPANGWPVAIFGHGFGDNKNNSPLAVASTLAHNGIATIAINAVGHGFGAGSTLTVIQGSGSVVLPAGGRGVDQNGNGVIDAFEGLFATGAQTDLAARDGVQQTVADLMQVVRAVQGGVDVDGNGSVALDASRIYYFGQSLGGIYGTVLLGIEPDIHAGVPNVPGGTFIDIARLGFTFRPLLGQFFASRVPSLINIGGLNFNDNMPLRNQPPVINAVPGAIDIQTVEDEGNWLAQAGDPLAWASFIRKSPLPGQAAKQVIIQFARGDQTVPNPTATALIRAGDLTDRTTLFRNDLAFALGIGFGKNPHTFLTNIAGSPAVAFAAIQAQTQIAVFFASNGALTIDPDGAGPLFETPINGPLPEDLAFIP